MFAGLKEDTNLELIKTWRSVVGIYSALQLSHENDSFSAISAVSKKIRSLYGLAFLLS